MADHNLQNTIDTLTEYRQCVRAAGADSVPAAILKTISVSEISTPVLSWIYYEQESTDEINIQNVIQRDLVRRNQIVGKHLFDKSHFVLQNGCETSFLRARDIIDQSWADLGKIISICIERVSLMPPNYDFESYTDPIYFGEIFFNMKRTNPIKWAEILAHEAGHTVLFAITSEESFFEYTDWERLVYSNIRKENRPLIGVYHGAIAQSFIMKAAQSFKANVEKLEPEEIKEIEKIFERFSYSAQKDIEAILSLKLDDANRELGNCLRQGLEIAKENNYGICENPGLHI